MSPCSITTTTTGMYCTNENENSNAHDVGPTVSRTRIRRRLVDRIYLFDDCLFRVVVFCGSVLLPAIMWSRMRRCRHHTSRFFLKKKPKKKVYHHSDSTHRRERERINSDDNTDAITTTNDNTICDSSLFSICQFLLAKDLAAVQCVSSEWRYAAIQTATLRLVVGNGTQIAHDENKRHSSTNDYYSHTATGCSSSSNNNNNNNNTTTGTQLILNSFLSADRTTQSKADLIEQFGVYALLYKLELHEHLPQWAAAAAVATISTSKNNRRPHPSLRVALPASSSCLAQTRIGREGCSGNEEEEEGINRHHQYHQLRRTARHRIQELPVQFQRKPYYLKCPTIGKIIMRLLIHSSSSQNNKKKNNTNHALYKLNYDNKQFMPIEIIPSSSTTTTTTSSSNQHEQQQKRYHPFGRLQIIQIRPHYVRLYFVKESMVVGTWNFGFLPPSEEDNKVLQDNCNIDPLKRTWFLDYQKCPTYVKPEYKLCTDWPVTLSYNNNDMNSNTSNTNDTNNNNRNPHSHNPEGIGILEEATMFWSTIQTYFLEEHHRIPIPRFCSYRNCCNEKKKQALRASSSSLSSIPSPLQSSSSYTKCSRCQIAYYCNKNCRAKAEPLHKIFCSHMKNLTTIKRTVHLYKQFDNNADDGSKKNSNLEDMFVDEFVSSTV